MLHSVLEALPRSSELRGESMIAPDEVATMVRLKVLGWGVRRIARELGCSHMTVRRYLEAGGGPGYRAPQRAKALDGLESWLAERFRRHRGNADVVRQELVREHGIAVSLCTVERAVQKLRRELVAEARVTARFETPPGRQLQIDFGSTLVAIADEIVRVFLFVATLGHSRRNFVAALRHERQSAWIEGLERTFGHFGGIPEEVLLDNAKPLVTYHDPRGRLQRPLPCLRARLGFPAEGVRALPGEDEDECGVGYAKRNAVAGRRFASWAELEGHLVRWMREVADTRIHGTTGEAPIVRFRRDELPAIRPLPARPPFRQLREVVRRVHADGCIDLDTNHYSVPPPRPPGRGRCTNRIERLLTLDGG